MSDETTPNTSNTEASTEAAKPAKAPRAAKAEAAGGEEKPARAKKEKAPALEDKPFADFINQDFLPALAKTLSTLGVSDLDLKLEKKKLPIAGIGEEECSQVIGRWSGGQRQVFIIFPKDDIQAPKFFCWSDHATAPSLLESFMIDERKVTLDLLLLHTIQRLNGQKWLVRN
jgi:hypothetical protein